METTLKANELNKDLHNRYKRKARDYDVEVEDIKRSRKDRPKFKMSNIEMDQMLNIQKRWGDLILKCLPEKTQMSISLGGGPDSAGRCYKTTVTKTYTNKMICKTCTGHRAGHNILDKLLKLHAGGLHRIHAPSHGKGRPQPHYWRC